MITRRLRLLTIAGIVLMVLHGVEEWVAGFYRVDPSFEFAARLVGSEQEALFLAFQLTWWLLLLLFGLLTFSPRWRLRGLGVFGAVMVFEWTHLGSSARAGGYFPGAVTAVLFVPLAVAFWVEYLRAYRCMAACAVCSTPIDPDAAIEVPPSGPGQVCSEACRARLSSR